MDKSQLLTFIRDMARAGILSRNEVNRAFDEGAGSTVVGQDKTMMKRNINIAQVLYTIGGLVVLLGIIVLIVQNWEGLPGIAHIAVTLGASIALYISAALLNARDSSKPISRVFYVLSMILLPLGLAVTFDEAGLNVSGFTLNWIIAAITFVVAMASFYVYRWSMFLIFSALSATWFYYAFLGQIIDNNPALYGYDMYQYLTMALGIGYLCVAYFFEKNTNRQSLASLFYAAGLIAFLGSALALSGFWELIYIGFVFIVIMMSVYIRSRIFLRIGALFLMAYILKITGKYFADSLSWPLALVLAGLMLIGVGYLTYYLNKKYIGSGQIA
jgi:hypothetical protein